MDPIVHGIRLGFAYGDIEFALWNVKVGIEMNVHRSNESIVMFNLPFFNSSFMQPVIFTVVQRKVR